MLHFVKGELWSFILAAATNHTGRTGSNSRQTPRQNRAGQRNPRNGVPCKEAEERRMRRFVALFPVAGGDL